MKEPPKSVVEIAVAAATESPCVKSKRGCVAFNPGRLTETIAISAHNGPPHPFTCAGSTDSIASYACRERCRDVCLHAEQRAILLSLLRTDLGDLELLHVKVVDGELVPGGGPSCLQCSRLILEVGLRGIWLFEAQRWVDELRCRACSQITVVAQGAGTTGVCEQCDHVGRLLDMPGKRVHDPTSGKWRYYGALDFHNATLREHNLDGLTVPR